ncbi:hypothetical protein F5Y14DRAFT_267575 [Nemania sp. NC0429]|nr:hypothetical protein F5Y14DRAFT_267575 [Nemania sp. NC0429]
MDALGLSTSRSNVACSSLEDLQGQLHQLLAAKASETRAEHISPSFELLSHTPFYLPGDPQHSPSDDTRPDAAQPQQPAITRTVIASETVQNQPADDPVLQKAVAKLISNAIGAVDSSAWTVRQVTRGAQGWQFTYICKDSLQAWNRANASNTNRSVIASHSGPSGLDPVNLSRPAFDCRGTLTIAFSKSSRNIVVKYAHTPLHKTVTQLVERLAPVPIPVASAPGGNNGSQRTPKPKRRGLVDGEEGSRKKKTPRARPSLLEGGEESTRKKRTPKAKRPPPVEGEDGGESRKKRRKSGKAPVANMGGLEDNQNTPQSEAQSNNAVDQPDFTGFLNVPPAEAERRRQTAIELLMGRGIEPTTLSSEQFTIFANQAPNLQSASLDMLAKYGAERLRIVHPDEKEQAGSSTSTPHASQARDTPSATAPAPLSGSTSTPTKKPRNRRRKTGEPPTEAPITEVSIGNGAVVSLEQDGEIGTTESALKPAGPKGRKTRGRCDTCRQRQVQCTKEHPSCSVCVDAGVDCVYLPPKPRRKSEKIAGTAEQNDLEPPEENRDVQHEEGEIGQATTPDPPEEQIIVNPEEPPAAIPGRPPMDIENEEFIPDPNILSGPVEHQTAATESVGANNYYQHSHNGIGFPQVPDTQATAETTSMPSYIYPQAQINEEAEQQAPNGGFSPPSIQPQHSHGLPASQPTSTSALHDQTQSVSSIGRKSLPTSVPASVPTNTQKSLPTSFPSHVSTSVPTSVPTSQSKQSPIHPPAVPVHAPSWGSSASIHHPQTSSPKTTHQQAAKRPKSRKPKAEPEKRGSDNLKQTISQPTQYQSPMTRSPYQSAAHVNPIQGQRSQTNTPVATNSRPPPQAPSTSTHQSVTATHSYNTPTTSGSIVNYDSHSRYNNTSNSSNSNANGQYADAGHSHASSRATYESGSYQPTPTTTAPSSYSSVPSYDYGRASGASNPLSQALNSTTTYSGTSGSTTNQWPTSQTRAAPNNNSSSAYSLPASSAPAPHGYSTRPSDSRTLNQNASYGQSQPQSYNSYTSQQSNLNQSGQQNWYGFSAANSSNQDHYTGNRHSGQSSHRSNAPTFPGHYSGNDEQAIYDLLRTGSSNH